MILIDAMLAFAITMAFLGTVVTMILEVGHRVFRVRKGNLINVLQVLSGEVGRGLFKEIGARGQWDFVVNVLNNPARAKGKLPTSNDIAVTDAQLSLPTALGQWKRKIGVAPDSRDPGDSVDWGNALASLGRVNGMRGIFDKVTLEHILRRFSELEPVREIINTSVEKAEQEFNRLSRKYMEFASSVSADFKRRSQMWSMVVGVLLAYVCNINGVLVFQAYLQNQDMTAQVISKLNEVNEKMESKEEENLKKMVQDIKSSMSYLDVLPIGSAYFPHCLFSNNKCKSVASEVTGLAYVVKLSTWFIATTLTGLLIGLGAPFWFDTAKRLANVRSMFGGKASAELRLGGRDVPADRPADRKALIRTILNDVIEERKLIPRNKPE